MAHAILVRSPHAHARIVSIDKRDALAAPGVLAVLTVTDYLAAGLGPIPHNSEVSAPPDVQARLRRGAPIATRHYPLPADRARFVGEPVVLVVAETIAAAKDAAELVEITWEPLPTMVRAADEVAPNAPALWDEAPDNVCIDIEVGDASATAETFARAAHVVRLDTCAHSDTGVPMEPRTNHAEYDPATGRYTLYTGSSCDAPKAKLDQPGIAQVEDLSRDLDRGLSNPAADQLYARHRRTGFAAPGGTRRRLAAADVIPHLAGHAPPDNTVTALAAARRAARR